MTGAGIQMIRCVGAIVHDAAGRLLMVRRATEPGKGLWSLPGGRVEAGETDVSAVARELLEETGLAVRVGALIGTVHRPASNGVFVIHDYAAEVTGGHLRAGDDAADAGWVDTTTFYRLERRGLLVPELAETLRGWQALPRA